MKLARRDFLAGAALASANLSLPAFAQTANTAPAAKLHLVDTHHHYIPPFYVDALGADAVGAGNGVPKWSTELSLQRMDQLGIDLALLSISNPGIALPDPKQAKDLARRCNEYARQMIVDHPQKFDAFVALPMPDVEASIAEVAYALDHLKFAGVGTMTNYNGTYIGDPLFDALFQELERRKAVVFVHPVAPATGTLRKLIPPPVVEFPQDTTLAIASLLYNGVFSKYPNVKFIFAHSGGTLLTVYYRFNGHPAPNGDDPIPILKRQHFDLAGAANGILTPALIAFAGTDHIVFGSDFPFGLEAARNNTHEYLLKLAQQNPDFVKIAHENAWTLFPQLHH